ncbi:MAG: bifunctional glutamate N-acetyltransferase/amino-acid acetyltransferase ArgJ [Candidatus Hydrogenedentes bacterium]|nr:bifunctional glutamate N-acetyltransferase/amino-acid acetyltransferase ArgJ [Candidatus Hydrogenedentota bacterium]MBI3119212.1 bifunctional glutamate N-acetyltransferase/amino-acid acetyltransferase ArgJ [Candidatus Hydrogenedentota bacterium]
MRAISGGVCAPAGFRAAGVSAQIKRIDLIRKDCALIASDAPACIAGTFTTNLVKAAPVQWSEGVCIRGTARSVFINSGNANACTGSQGVQDAQATAERAALSLGIPVTEVCVLSTGVIGVPLPMDRIRNGVDAAVRALSEQGGGDAAEAIMTTDTVPKERAYEVQLSQGVVRLGAIAKGAGMIAPNMATLLCVITSDAAIAVEHLQPLLADAVNQSFNRICVDNDMSTNDAVLCLCNGRAPAAGLKPGTPDFDIFAAALRALCVEMAQLLVRDGEGATKFVEICVSGAPNDLDARTIARSVATSQLCKTAFFGQDANWGRIACAAGYAGVPFDPNLLSITVEGLEVVHDGLPTVFEEADAAALMKRPELHLDISVGDGPGTCTFWTCDLSHDYVSINADYRT